VDINIYMGKLLFTYAPAAVGRDFLGGGQHIYYIFVSPQALPLLITHLPAQASGEEVGAEEQEEEQEEEDGEEDGLYDSCPSRSFERYLAVWVPVCIYIRKYVYTYIRMYVHTCCVLISPPMPIHYVLAAVFASYFCVLIYLLQE